MWKLLDYGERLLRWAQAKRAEPHRQQAAEALKEYLKAGQVLQQPGYGGDKKAWFANIRAWHAESINLLVTHDLPADERMMYETRAPDHGEPLTTNHNRRSQQLDQARQAHADRVAKLRILLARYMAA